MAKIERPSDQDYRRAMRFSIRELPSKLFGGRTLTTEFQDFVDAEIIPTLNRPKYKIDEWRLVVRQCVFNVLTAGLVTHTIADSHHRNSTPPLRISVWGTLETAGWIEVEKGSEASGKVTRQQATTKLYERRDIWRLKMLDAGEELPDNILVNTAYAGHITLRARLEVIAPRDPQNIALPDQEAVQNALTNYWNEMDSYIGRINENNLSHAWVAVRVTTGIDGMPKRVLFQSSIIVKQIHAGEINRMARLYTGTALSAQSMPKDQRATMLIDGSPTVELDFSCFNIRMLYHSLQRNPRGDVYKPAVMFPRLHKSSGTTAELKKRVRDFIKEATNTTLTTFDRNVACGAVHKMLEEARRDVRQTVYGVERSNPSDMLRRIENAHPELQKAGKFYTGVGENITTKGGRIMLQILLRLADAKKPALGIHDSVLVKAEDANFARRVMTEVYYQFNGFQPVIK